MYDVGKKLHTEIVILGGVTVMSAFIVWGVNSAKSSIFSFVCPKHICMSKTHLTVHK